MQCLRRYNDTGKRHPNLPNALKYALAMLVTLAGVFNPALKERDKNTAITPFQIFWIMAYFASTLYSWAWDVIMDWNVFDFNNKEGGYVRSRRVIENVWVYYIVSFVDLILRFFWTWTLIPNESAANFSALNLFMAPFAAILEIFRRSMWSVFRLENEQLNNTAGYRDVTHIPLHYESKFDMKSGEEPQSEEDKEKLRKIRCEIFAFFSVVVSFVIISVVYSN
jgi:xenotropic and polytropic retrovirus receptor 1